MNKKLMAVAVAGVLTAPAAFAQSSNVELYGRANVGFDSFKATGATNPALDRDSRYRVFDSGSRVGFRGTEDLGGGLRAIFQIETGVNIDSGQNYGQSGQNNQASTGFLASRDSFVGLAGGWGQVTFGRQSVFWANGLNGQFGANYVNQEIPWQNGTGLGRIGFPVARQNDVVAYTSPTFAGINGTLSFSPTAQEAVQTGTAQTVNVGGGATAVTLTLPGTGVQSDGAIWGLTLRGTWGGIYAQYDYAQNKADTVTSTGFQAKNEGHKLGLSWGYMPGARVGLNYVRIYNNNVTTASSATNHDKVRQDGWVLFWEHTFGQFQVLAEYGQSQDMKGCTAAAGVVAGTLTCDQTSSKGYMLGGRYFMSKRTWVYLTYLQVTNEGNQYTDWQGAGISSVAAGNYNGFGGVTPTISSGPMTPYGADPKVLAFGIFHNF
jgi:predicted porin